MTYWEREICFCLFCVIVLVGKLTSLIECHRCHGLQRSWLICSGWGLLKIGFKYYTDFQRLHHNYTSEPIFFVLIHDNFKTNSTQQQLKNSRNTVTFYNSTNLASVGNLTRILNKETVARVLWQSLSQELAPFQTSNTCLLHVKLRSSTMF